MDGRTKELGPYGAALTHKQYWTLVLAICLGTVVEWYDFTSYSQLNPVLTTIFFPASSPGLAQISFWGIYAAGFVVRPIGALFFGHIGDTVGRRKVLLATIITMTVPTVLIGCLPTYASWGRAAPALLAVLRFVQGFATGGEFGSSIVYLHEIAGHGRKGVTASLGQMAIGPGIVASICIVEVILAVCSEDQLLVWGWRIPFLLSIVNLISGLLLRMHMPEPREFLESRQQMVAERITRVASNTMQQRFFGRPGSATRRPGQHSSFKSTRGACQQLLLDTTPTNYQHQQQDQATKGHMQWQQQQQVVIAGAAGGEVVPSAASRIRSRSGNKTPQPGEVGAAGCDTAPVVDTSQVSSSSSQRLDEFGRLKVLASPFAAPAAQLGRQLSGAQIIEFQAEVAFLATQIKNHVPLEVLLRNHWLGMLLQIVFYAWAGAAFFVYYSWVPSWLYKQRGFPSGTTLWMALTGVVGFTCIVPLVGHLGDKGIPRVWVALAAIALSGLADVPTFIAFNAAPLGVVWLLLVVQLVLVGVHAGLMTSMGPLIYPPGVRVSGYNFAHNVSASLLGGVAPLIITSLKASTGSQVLAPGLTLAVVSTASFLGGLGLLKYAPQCNRGDQAPTAGSRAASGIPA